jgi:long-chain acyl-CoA synthetase
MNIVEHIFQKADRNAVALICAGEKISYGELIGRTEEAAARIAQSAAERVALDCPNGVAHVVLALAIVRAGKCLVPIASELAAPERERVLRETGVGAIVGEDGGIVPRASGLCGTGGTPGSHPELAALNPAFIRFSSGTTGTSKGIVISHETLLARVTAANRGLGIGPADRIVWILPMAHHFAVSIMLYLLHGAATIIENSHLAEDVLGAALAHGGTVLYGAPFHHALLASEESGRAWPTLRLAVSTAAALPTVTAEAFLARYGLPLTQGLGVIEVGLPLLNLHAAREKPGAIGRPLPDFEARLDDDGALFVRGPGLLDAYLQPWRSRAEILEDGWFRTGDLARVDEDGDYFLLGRSSSVINVAGLKCFPEEIETVLAQVEGVRAVRVSGRPHPKVGAVPLAEIVPVDPVAPPKVSALIGHCRSQLARYKVPVEFRFVESLPLTASGKIKR